MLDKMLLLGLIILAFTGPEAFEVGLGLWGIVNLFTRKLKISEIFGRVPPLDVWKSCLFFGIPAAIGIAGIEFLLIGVAIWIKPSLLNAIIAANRQDEITYVYQLVIAPVIEEVLLRGVLLTLLSRRFGVTGGLFGAAIFFGFLHGEPIGHTLMGLLLGVMYLATSSLCVPIVLHILNNAMAIGLDVLTKYFGIRVLNPNFSE